ncbi:MAG TPA: hypothetical protein DCF68_18640 [Cyanothece sp. UBA12306]|nr:hypothetical protein [Cyanothece sp. UBA12306]
MNQTIWGPLKVHDFFSTYNWSGIPPKLEPLEQTEDRVDPSTWLSLTIGDFFRQANWTGKSIQQLSQRPSTVVPSLSVTLSVGEFFGGMNWFSSRQIQSVSANLSPVIPASSKNLNINNLSDLF